VLDYLIVGLGDYANVDRWTHLWWMVLVGQSPQRQGTLTTRTPTF